MGWKAKDMTAGLPGILNLAAASGEELGTTSDIVTDALTAFGLQAKDSSHFADILASASSNSNTNVSMLGESFKYCAPVAGALGISAKDTSFALGLMANAGIKGSSSGTALRASLVNLAKPTKQMQKSMNKLGISLTDSSGKVKTGKVLFDELRQKFSKLSDAQKAQYASTIFGKEAMSGMLAIINASDSDYKGLYKNLSNCDKVSEKMAGTMQNNLKGSLTNLKSAFEEMQISLSQTLIPVLTKLVKFVNKLINKFNALPQPLKNFITKLLSIIALTAPLLLAFGKVIKVVGSVIGIFKKVGDGVFLVLKTFSKLKNGINLVVKSFSFLKKGAMIFQLLPTLITPHTLIIIAAIAAIGFVVYEVIKHWDGLKKAATKLWKHISKQCKEISNFFKTSVKGWKLLWKDFSKFMSKVGHWICDGLFGGLSRGWKKVKSVTTKIAGGIKNTFKKMLGINSPSKVFSAYGNHITDGLIGGLGSNREKIKNLTGKIAGGIKNTFKKILGINSPSRSFQNYGGHISNGLIGGLLNNTTKVNSNITSLAEGIKNTFKKALEISSYSKVFQKYGSYIGAGLVQGLFKSWEKIKQIITQMANGIKKTFKKALDINSPSRVFKEYGCNVGDGFIQGINDKNDIMNSTFKGMANKIKKIGNISPKFGSSDNLDVLKNSMAYKQNNMSLNHLKPSITQNINMYVTIPNLSKEGTQKISNEFKSMAKTSLKNSMINLFMNDAIRE